MKKMLCLVMAIAMTLAIGVPAFAVNTTDGSTIVYTTVDVEYTVNIPDDEAIVFGTLSTPLQDLKLVTATLHPDGYVTIGASSGPFANSIDADETISYTLKSGENAFTSVDFDAVGETAALSVDVAQSTWDAAPAGSYSGTITFTITYTDGIPVAP